MPKKWEAEFQVLFPCCNTEQEYCRILNSTEIRRTKRDNKIAFVCRYTSRKLLEIGKKVMGFKNSSFNNWVIKPADLSSGEGKTLGSCSHLWQQPPPTLCSLVPVSCLLILQLQAGFGWSFIHKTIFTFIHIHSHLFIFNLIDFVTLLEISAPLIFCLSCFYCVIFLF